MNILYIEDNQINRFVFEKRIKKCNGFFVKTVESPEEGIQEACSGKYNHVFIDINLNHPRLDGFDVLTAIRESDSQPEQVFALTSYSGADWRRKCLEAGFDDFLEKPFDPFAFYQNHI